MLRGDGKVYIIKTPDIKLPYEMTNFLGNSKNKEQPLNLIEKSIAEDKNKLNERAVFFLNKEFWFKISSDHILQEK